MNVREFEHGLNADNLVVLVRATVLNQLLVDLISSSHSGAVLSLISNIVLFVIHVK